MSISKRQVSSSSIFVSFFIAMTHNSTVNFKHIHFLLWTKGSHQSSNFDIFERSGENLPNSWYHFPNNKSFFFQILHHSSMSWKITPPYFFSSNNIYFAQKKRIKVKTFETFERSGQIPYANFETTSRFLSKFCTPLQFHERQLLCTFLAQTIYTLLKTNTLKWKGLKVSSARVKIHTFSTLD